jgi:hypothetical protein
MPDGNRRKSLEMAVVTDSDAGKPEETHAASRENSAVRPSEFGAT